MKLIPITLFVLLNYSAVGQIQSKTVMDLVPEGWFVTDSSYGDLNNDNLIDAALVIQKAETKVIIDSFLEANINVPRTLMILFRQKDGSYRLIERNKTIIISRTGSNMDDPFKDIYVKNGVQYLELYIFYNAGGWEVSNLTYKFQLRQNVIGLIGAEYNSINRGSLNFENYSFNFLTGRCKIEKGNDNKGTSKKSVLIIKKGRLKMLKEIQEPFTWEVLKNVRI